MPRQTDRTAERLAIQVAFVIALSIMGDSLMYSLLPLEAAKLGLPLTFVGILLSANRWVRLASNTWASLSFERWGAKIPFIIAAALGFIVAVFYQGLWGAAVFLAARVLWGVAWSLLRQGNYQAVWAAPANQKGRLMGLTWGIVRAGSAVAVLLGGWLYDRWDYRTAVLVIAAFTALAIPAATQLKWGETRAETQKAITTNWPTLVNTPIRRRLLLNSVTYSFFEATFAATLSLYLSERLAGQAVLNVLGIGTLAGALLALRYIANILFGPMLGAYSDRVGQARLMIVLSIVILAALTGLETLPGWAVLPLLAVIFIGLAGMWSALSAASSGVAAKSARPHAYAGLFNTGTDLGSAFGPVLAFSAAEWVGFGSLYIVVAAIVLGTILLYAHAGAHSSDKIPL